MSESALKREVGYIKPRGIIEEMKVSYLDYAMSIIVSRALPDVRDGLKPSQRRILYAMHKLGLNQSARFRKSALVVGDVLGKYHPHGDMAVYDALVRLAQDFSLRYPLVKGQGNFGSIDGDSAAHMRYTECKMTGAAEELLKNIEKDTVDFVDNYDASRKEPKVLPAALPQLLINGAVGIAVGMATNIPPHNLGEILDAAVYLLDHPEAEIKDLLNFVQGPDFPTGGILYSSKDILEAYSTGRGKVVTRALAEIVESKKDRFAIIVKEVTYQSNKATTITRIADLVKTGKITGIKDLRDESDKDGIRIVVELKKDAQPKKILNQLYRYTDLQKNFNFNMLALEGGIQPRVMNLKEMLFFYLEYRREVITRRSLFELNRAKERAHILEGLKKAIDHIDEVIKIIKSSADKEVARQNLIKKFAFSERQTEAILEMRLQTLAGLERKRIEEELAEKLRLIHELEDLLASPEKIKALVKKELIESGSKYKDKRRTRVFKNAVNEFSDEDLVPKEDVIILISRGGYIKRMNPNNYRVQHRGGIGVIGASTKEDDIISHLFTVNTHDNIFFFTETGKVYVTKAYEIAEGSKISRGQAIANFLSLSQKEKITAVLPIGDGSEAKNIFMTTRQGTVKRIALSEFTHVRRNGIAAIRLNAGDELWWTGITSGDDELILTTALGQSIRFKEKNIRLMGRAAAGVRGIRLQKDDQVVGASVITNGETKGKKLLVITENGYGKKTDLSRYKIQNRGGSGIKTIKIMEKNGRLAHVSVVGNATDEPEDIIATSIYGTIIRTKISGISELGRVTQGVRIMKLRKGDRLSQATKI